MKRFLLAILVTALASPSLATDTRPTPLPKVIAPVTEEITVTSSRLRTIVRTFVDVATAPSPLNQVSRWKVPVCPRTTGMRPAFTDFVSKRIRDIAADIGAPVNAGTDCKPNLQIIFTEHPQAMLDTIRTKLPTLLGYHYKPQAKELATVEHPIQGWYATGSRDRRGQLIVDFPSDEISTATVEGSRLLTGMRSEFMAVTVVVDLVVIENQEIGAIADHAAMLAFSQSGAFERCREVPSITNMLLACDAEMKATALTPYDRAYLKALYHVTDRDTPASLQKGNIAYLMRKYLSAE